MDKLTPGALLNIFKNNDTSTPIYVQAHQAKTLSEGANRIRMMVNDGKWFLNAVFKPTEHQQVLENFQKFSVIHVTNYSISGVNGKYFILLNQCEVVGSPERVDANFSNLDHYLKEHPDENTFQKSLDSGIASGVSPAAGTAVGTETKPAAAASPAPSNSNPYTDTKPRVNTPSASSNGKAAVPANFKGLTTIDQLSPYHNSWAIKARVSYKGDMRTWSNQRGQGKLFSVHLLDETGEIKATAFNTAAEKFFDIFQENGVYYVTKASIQTAKKQFSNLANDNEINLDKDSLVEPANDESGVPQMQFNFTKLDQIQNIENNTIVDVLGIVKNVEEKREITSKSTGKPYDRRDITIVDQSQFAINVGLWNKLARDFNLDPGTPIAIKGCKVNDFNGKQLSLIPSAIVMANPDLPDAYKLKGWYDNEGASESYKSLRNTSNGNSDLNSKDSILQRITIATANETKLGFNEKPDYFSMKASVSFVKPDNFSYPACATEGCSKKVIEQSDGTWRCERCSVNHPEPLHRYILTISVVDETGQMWLNLFNEQGEALLGCDAKKLLEMKEASDENLLKNYLTEKVLFREYAFRVRARLDSYQGVDRARFQAVSLSSINPSTESDALIEQLDKLEV